MITVITTKVAVNNLNSNDVANPLSAYQGKVLNDKISNISSSLEDSWDIWQP